MPEHLTTQQIEALTTRRLAVSEIVTATRHLAVCGDCRQRVSEQTKTLERVGSLRSALRAEASEFHLRYEQLVTYVENSAEVIEREIIVNHLEACAQCAFEAEELQALHDSLTTPQAEPRRHSFIEWLRRFWQMPAFLRPLPLTAIAASLLLLFTAVWWLRKPTSAPQIAVTQPLPVTTPTLPAPSPLPIETPAVVATLMDNGRQIALDAAGKVTGFTALSKDAERALRQALETQKVETPAELKDLLRPPTTLMGSTEEQQTIKLHSPIGTFVKDTQPAFRWQAVKGAQHYTVLVLDENFNVVATSPALTQPLWRATSSLQRGQEYLWQVTAEVDGKRVTSASAHTPEAHFKILSAEKAHELQALTQPYRDSHLLLGTMYAKAGLLDEAEREYRALLKVNPHSAIARKLLQQLRAVRKS